MKLSGRKPSPVTRKRRTANFVASGWRPRTSLLPATSWFRCRTGQAFELRQVGELQHHPVSLTNQWSGPSRLALALEQKSGNVCKPVTKLPETPRLTRAVPYLILRPPAWEHRPHRRFQSLAPSPAQAPKGHDRI